jgi:hypothetical protein
VVGPILNIVCVQHMHTGREVSVVLVSQVVHNCTDCVAALQWVCTSCGCRLLSLTQLCGVLAMDLYGWSGTAACCLPAAAELRSI